MVPEREERWGRRKEYNTDGGISVGENRGGTRKNKGYTRLEGRKKQRGIKKRKRGKCLN